MIAVAAKVKRSINNDGHQVGARGFSQLSSDRMYLRGPREPLHSRDLLYTNTFGAMKRVFCRYRKCLRRGIEKLLSA